MQRAMDAGFGGVALFTLGYADNEVWSAVDTVAASLAGSSTSTTPTEP